MPVVDVVLTAALLAVSLAAAVIGSPRVPAAAVAVPGAVLLTVVGAVSWSAARDTVTALAPTVAFLVVLLLLAYLADREGLFDWAAAVTARRSGRSPRRLFARVVLVAAAVTAVLSLDATAVLLTPVVVATAARMGVPDRPQAYATGHLANSASLLMPVSNLTNLLAFAATGVSFVHFTALMAGPWLVVIAVEYLVLRTVFRRDLDVPVAAPVTGSPPAPVLALSVIGLTVVGFGVASALGIAPVVPAALAVLVLGVPRLVTGRSRPGQLLRAADLPFGLFVLGLAIVVRALQDAGLADLLTAVLPDGQGLLALLGVAAVAAVLANLVNNLPATLALVPAAAAGGAPTVLAVLIGVNVGPNLTYVGSLATLLWRKALGRNAPGAVRFSVVGLATVPLTLVAGTVALWLTLQVLPGQSLAAAAGLADGDHRLDRLPRAGGGRGVDVHDPLAGAQRVQQLGRGDHLHVAAGGTGVHRDEVGAAVEPSQLVQDADLGGHEHLRGGGRGRGRGHAAGRQHPGPVGRQVTVADQVQHGGGAAALGVHQDLGVRVGGDLRPDVGRADPGVHVALPRPDGDVAAPGDPLDVRAEELVGAEEHLAVGRDRP
ncbi:MAG: arsB, partial [Modestobacter sp.]|nr:arsB [Modestobacter sp.]